MLIYSYAGDTKEFIGVETAEADREASLRLGKFVPLIPANATLIKPPTAEVGKTAVFEDDNWIMKKDHRGKLAVCPTTDEIEEIDYIGDLKAGFVFYDEYIKTNEYREKQQSIKEAKLKALAMKPLDFINAVETLGITYEKIMAYCQENSNIDKYLKFSDQICRGDEILNDFIIKFGVTSEKMDKLFKDYGG